ncbi:AraC-like DNA-binding protein [Kordia periserrulae]|uniref:AraC-like DNA-binding protein n=1 Tax=Kordia periserrulae TaxID=701523 RepID=A0A2T6BVR3_9FLAO|nr:helix-turn-helix domain-containing protein [Kordia periserrulae]PTX60152.1 AraC-like DNA-binding protein [Kordia periserrulae]
MQNPKTIFSLICTFVFLCSLSLNAQVDSLQGKSYEELITLFEATMHTNATSAEIYAQEAYQKANILKDQKKIGTALYAIAASKYYLGKYEETLQYTDKSLQIAKAIENNKLLFDNYTLEGNAYSNLKEEFKALDQYLLAKKYADLLQEPINIITVSVNIAYLKKLHYDHQEALEILKENLIQVEKIPENHPRKQLYERILLMNIADTYLRINNPIEAARYNDIAMNSCENDELNTACVVILMNDAIIKYQKQEYDKAIEISTEVKNSFLTLKSENMTVTPYFYLGKSFYKKKQYKKAIENLEKAIQLSIDKDVAFTDQKEAHKILYQAYTELGNTEKAKENFNHYSTLDVKNDSINMQLNNTIHKKYDIVPLQDEVALLDSTNQKQRKLTKYLYISLAFLVVFLVGFFIWFKRKQGQNKLRFQKLLVKIDALEQQKKETNSQEEVSKEHTNPVTDENVLQILKGLEAFEEKEWYLRQDCTLSYVAKKLKTNTSYLSNVINTYKEKPFRSYLSELRINAALIKLKNDDKLRSYTIKAIANEFGFKRSETFSRVFKAHTEMYPSDYIKSLENQKNK